MIDHFEADECGCLKSVQCDLTPIHAFIGPNDSGKSTLLKAICETVNTASGAPYAVGPGGGGRRLEIRSGGVRYELSAKGTAVIDDGKPFLYPAKTSVRQLAENTGARTENGWGLFAALRDGAWIARFDADALRQSSSLLPPAQVSSFLTHRGRGLPGVYDLIQGRADGSFEKIQKDLYDLFPSVRRFGLVAISQSEKMLQFELRDGTEVTAAECSEGLLYYVAFAALAYLRRPSLIAIEEPENGLHPARIAQVMRILRNIANEGTQVLIATHSPLVVNELEASEVSVVTRSPESGTKITALKSTPNFDQRSKVYALGELWLSYADGKDESALLNGGPSAAVSTP